MKSLHKQMGNSDYLGKEHRIHQQIRKPNECQLQGGRTPSAAGSEAR